MLYILCTLCVSVHCVFCLVFIFFFKVCGSTNLECIPPSRSSYYVFCARVLSFCVPCVFVLYLLSFSCRVLSQGHTSPRVSHDCKLQPLAILDNEVPHDYLSFSRYHICRSYVIERISYTGRKPHRSSPTRQHLRQYSYRLFDNFWSGGDRKNRDGYIINGIFLYGKATCVLSFYLILPCEDLLRAVQKFCILYVHLL